MFSFFRKKPPPPTDPTPPLALPAVDAPPPAPGDVPAVFGAPTESAAPPPVPRRGWLDQLRQGLRKTASTLSQAFTGTKIDEALYEDLEAALLQADAGVAATEFLLEDLKRRVKDAKATDASAVRALLEQALTDLLSPLQRPLQVGETVPTVMMVVGVNGAGKTTSIGKLARHLADADARVLLAAADTFRAAAREQLSAWADRAGDRAGGVTPASRVEIVSQEGGDPSAVSFDAVKAGIARGCDVVLVDTAGRLPTQLHLMEELKKLRRTVSKAMEGAPHEVLLVIDGNTGQNALAQVKAFDEALTLSGVIITKLDGTAKGGSLAALALWGRERSQRLPAARGIAVYFIGVGERLEDLQPFDAREFAHALVG